MTQNNRGKEPIIELRHVEKHFGDLHVLKDINLEVDRGEVLVVIGPSGSGKSTMCRTINRLETIDSGEILIEGKPLPQEGRELTQMRAELGMVFQSFNLFAHMTILENVTLGPIQVLGMKKEEAEKVAMDLLTRVGVAEQANKVPAQLSGGQQQRVAIARALANNPRIMLCDEATSALDTRTTVSVLNLLAKINKELGVTLVVITHSLAVARHICDRVAVIDEGVIVEEGPTRQVLENPQSEAARELVSFDSLEVK